MTNNDGASGNGGDELSAKEEVSEGKSSSSDSSPITPWQKGKKRIVNDKANNVSVAAVLRKSRSRWRIFAFLALALSIFALIGRAGLEQNIIEKEHIARIIIEDIITTDAERLEILNKIAENENIKAVIISINSPGGTTAGGEELYEAISNIRMAKPVIATIHELGASAAYMSAIASDRIYARRLSVVGSIGVLYQHIDASKLMQTIGIDLDKVATGPLKAEPDIDEPLEGEVRRSMQELVNDSFDWFVDIVSERRNISRNKTLQLADGRILTGRMALKANLIDDIGSEYEALKWLAEEKNIRDLEIITHYPLPENEFEQIARYIGTKIGSIFGINPNSPIALDGLISLWQARQ